MTLMFIIQNQLGFQYRGHGPIVDLKEIPRLEYRSLGLRFESSASTIWPRYVVVAATSGESGTPHHLALLVRIATPNPSNPRSAVR